MRALPPVVTLEVPEARRVHSALVEMVQAARRQGVPVPTDLFVFEAALAAVLDDLAVPPEPSLPTLPVDEYSALTGKNPRTVRRMCESGRLPARKVGGSWQITAR